MIGSFHPFQQYISHIKMMDYEVLYAIKHCSGLARIVPVAGL